MEFCTANGRLQPGFRFYPTDEELVMYYLKRKVLGKRLEPMVVAEVDIYQFHPEDLRDLACLQKDRNWYFFCPRGKKYGCGDRTNRATNTGYWKATGSDRLVTYGQRTVGKIKTLVFHLGKPPKGDRTDWVMHEFRLDDKKLADLGVAQDSYVLCKIFKKSGWGPKTGEQYGAPFIEEEWDDKDEIPDSAQMVPCDVQNQSISAVTHVNTCTSEQVYSGSVSVSAVDQAPPSTSNAAAANLASSSKIPILYYNAAVNEGNAAMPIHSCWASTSTAAVPNYYDPAVQVPTPAMPMAAATIAMTSTGPVPFYDDDEIFTADDLRGIFEDLPDLDNGNVQGNEPPWGNFYEGPEGGLGLTDLDESL